MTAPLRVGVVGCGIIATRYVEDSTAFENWQPAGCADLDPALAERFARSTACGRSRSRR